MNENYEGEAKSVVINEILDIVKKEQHKWKGKG